MCEQSMLTTEQSGGVRECQVEERAVARRSESYNNQTTKQRGGRGGRGENEKQQREMRGKKGERQRKRKKKKENTARAMTGLHTCEA
jgi:hypothetical protein